jgi:hypothetical protein
MSDRRGEWGVVSLPIGPLSAIGAAAGSRLGVVQVEWVLHGLG